ncbi:MAG: fibrobacter succinogenes major paralogous domain-containing protein [Bacteroidia bacterium]|nr:fibrobacter succinogenes major paralogous domain-containing protein [Bacteroidia bacterium]
MKKIIIISTIAFSLSWSVSVVLAQKGITTNAKNEEYGNEKSVTAPSWVCGTSAITDFDGNSYNTVQIGSQCWMRENLKTTHYADGTALVDGTNAGNISRNYNAKYWFVYKNDLSNKTTYGLLYTWAAAMNGTPGSNTNTGIVQGVCPAGWHLPNDAEWEQMEMFLGMSQSQADATGWRGTTEGGKLKEAGTSHWTSPNAGADNSSGYNALPGGYRDDVGIFYYLGNTGTWWTASEYFASDAWNRSLNYNYSQVIRNDDFGSFGYSVRCIRNQF